MKEILELLEKYSKFLEEYGYIDTDWREEKPTAIHRFLSDENKSFPVELPVLLPKRNSFGQWISVKDKLPELDETVLCYSKVKDIDGNTYNVTSLGSRFINYTQKPVFLAESGRFAETIEIIKWMPLPKP